MKNEKWKAERGIGNEASCLMDSFIGGRDAAFPIFGYTRKSRLRRTTRTIAKNAFMALSEKAPTGVGCMRAFQACDIVFSEKAILGKWVIG